MKLLGPMHLTLLFLALVNMVPAIEAEASWGVLAIAAAAAVISCIYYKLAGRRCVPPVVLCLLVMGAVAYLGYEMFLPHEAPTVHILDLSHFIIFLCCCKFFELRSYRDAALIALVALLLMIISAFVSASPLFGVALAIDATIGVGWLITFHLQRETDAVLARRRARLGALADQVKDIAPELIQWPRRRHLRAAVTCSGVLLVLASFFFVSAPRGWGSGFLHGLPRFVGRTVTGFSGGISLSDNDIYEDDSTVMRVRYVQDGRAITDSSFSPYMRGQTFDRYFRGRWQRTASAHRDEVLAGTKRSPSLLLDAAEGLEPDQMISQEVWLESTTSGALFSLYPPLAFGSSDVMKVRLDRDDCTLLSFSPSRQQAHYVAYAMDETTPALTQRLLRWPGQQRDGRSRVSRRVGNFARSFAADVGDPTDSAQFEYIAERFRDYLRSERFEYTLQRGPSKEKGDLVADFLFDNPRGHCEYFASAMTLMCQVVGIPARLVSGYQGGELNEAGGFYQFRQRDAHTWVEVYLPDRGWTQFDPTPSVIGDVEPDDSLLAKSKQFCDFVQFKWAAMVFSFDSDTRAILFRGFGDWFAKLTQQGETPRSVTSTLKSMLWGPDVLAFWQRVLYWLLIVLCLALVILVLRFVWLVWLRLREYLPAAGKTHRGLVRRAEARFYDRLVLLLSRRGHVKSADQTPREFAQSLAVADAELAELPECIEWFYEAQFGRRSLGEERHSRVTALLNRLRETPLFAMKEQ
jgi:hypothetical protein